MRLFGWAAAAAAIGAMTFAASPAEARRYHDKHRGKNNSGAVVVAGIAGVAIGAALAGSGRGRQYGGYYGQTQGYYGGGYYGQPQGYYGQQNYYGQVPNYGYGGNYAYGSRYSSNPHSYHSARKERKHLRNYYRNQRHH